MTSIPKNPFSPPEHAQDREAFSSPLFVQASHLAEKYIEARQKKWPECAERIDSDIGAFLSESFENKRESLFFSRFVSLYKDCNAAFGSLDHGHCLWAFNEPNY